MTEKSARLRGLSRGSSPPSMSKPIIHKKTVADETIPQNPDERVKLIAFIRNTLDEADLSDTPIVAGVGGSSTRETIALAQAAEKAGA